MNFNSNFTSGAFFLLFTGASFAMALSHLPATTAQLETPSAEALLKGAWAPKFEDQLNKALPVATASRNFWGGAEYAAFHDGRKGVVTGLDGWLFTSEEFSCPARYETNLAENLAYIEKTAARAKVAVVLIPAKARVYAAQTGKEMPPCRKWLYDEAMSFLKLRNIEAPQLLPAMTGRDGVFLKTDTHWSPAGARIAAQEISLLLADAGFEKHAYRTKSGDMKERAGDLTRYVPGVDFEKDKYPAFTTAEEVTVAAAGAAQDLFGTAAPPVTLVGTSYSANPDWHFEGFLKESLQADVLNMADEGQGPFTVMDAYLESTAWKENPPALIVWEIPERYLLMPHGVPPV
ncbi:MAG: alginate O-acetyltransferase [Alphaproteobacteria bacterium]